MKSYDYEVHYIDNHNSVIEWTEHKRLESALNNSYYWLNNHSTAHKLSLIRIYKVLDDYTLSLIAEIHR